jgi:hypothetical protein
LLSDALSTGPLVVKKTRAALDGDGLAPLPPLIPDKPIAPAVVVSPVHADAVIRSHFMVVTRRVHASENSSYEQKSVSKPELTKSSSPLIAPAPTLLCAPCSAIVDPVSFGGLSIVDHQRLWSIYGSPVARDYQHGPRHLCDFAEIEFVVSARLLAATQPVALAGKLVALWKRGHITDWTCGCDTQYRLPCGTLKRAKWEKEFMLKHGIRDHAHPSSVFAQKLPEAVEEAHRVLQLSEPRCAAHRPSGVPLASH